MQVREQNIKQWLGNTGANHQGDDIKLEILGVFQALGNEISKQRERQRPQGPHDKFMFREKEYGRMVNHHCDEGNEFNHNILYYSIDWSPFDSIIFKTNSNDDI